MFIGQAFRTHLCEMSCGGGGGGGGGEVSFAGLWTNITEYWKSVSYFKFRHIYKA